MSLLGEPGQEVKSGQEDGKMSGLAGGGAILARHLRIFYPFRSFGLSADQRNSGQRPHFSASEYHGSENESTSELA